MATKWGLPCQTTNKKGADGSIRSTWADGRQVPPEESINSQKPRESSRQSVQPRKPLSAVCRGLPASFRAGLLWPPAP